MEGAVFMKRFIAFLSISILCVFFAGCVKKVITIPSYPEENLPESISMVSQSNSSSKSSTSSGVATVKASTGDLVALAKDTKNHYGYINTNGQWVIAPEFLGGTQFSDGLAAVKTRGTDSHWQIIDKSGAVKAEFNQSVNVIGGSHFSNGLIRITGSTNSKFGFADIEGKVIVQPTYKQVLDFSEGLAAVCSDKGWGFIDAKGNTVIPCQYEIVHSFSSNRAYVKYTPPADSFKDGDAFIDQTGRIVFEDIGPSSEKSGFEQYMSDFQNGVSLSLYMLREGGKGRGLGLVNDSGQLVWFDSKQEMSKNTSEWDGENLFAVLLSDTYGFLDTSGKLVCTIPDGFGLIGGNSGFSDGLCAIRNKASRMLGYMDKSGTVVISDVYQSAKAFFNGYAAVSMDGQIYSYIDKDGKTVASGDYVNTQMPFTK